MPEDTHEVDQYQKELSATVDDGGGCAEMWDVLTEARENTEVSRRSMLRRAGSATAGLALASTLQAALASTAEASKGRSNKVLRVVEEDEAFRSVKRRLRSALSDDDDVAGRNERRLFSSRTVKNVEVGGTTHQIASYSGSVLSNEKDIELSVEISTLVQGMNVRQVRGLIKKDERSGTKYVSVTNDTEEIKQTSAVLESDDRRENTIALAQQAQCIPCYGEFCASTCIAVWDTICYNSIGDALCSSAYTTTAACLIITLIGGGVGGAVCAIFLAAVCEGDVGCYDTPENMCEDSSSACDDPWLN